MFNTLSDVDTDTDNDTDDIETTPELDTMNATRALVTAMFKGIDTSAVRDALKGKVPQVILLIAPSTAWAKAVSSEVSRAYDGVLSIAVTETKKRNDWVSEQVLSRLNVGRHVVICASDQPDLLPPEALRAVDLRLVLPGIDAALVRRAIGLFCGKRATGLKAADLSAWSSSIWSWRFARAVRRGNASIASAISRTNARRQDAMPVLVMECALRICRFRPRSGTGPIRRWPTFRQ